MAVPLLQLTHIIRLLLPDPEDLFHGCLEGDEFRGEDRKFLFQIKLHDLMRQFVGRHTRAVLAECAFIQYVFHDAEIFLISKTHGSDSFLLCCL